jgi:hypothetical protein
VRRWIAGVVAGALLVACTGGGSTSAPSTTTLPASVVDNGTAAATKVIDKLTASGLPIGPTSPHPSNDPIFDAFDGLVGKVDFRDGRLLTSSSDIDENVDGGSVEVYRDERTAIAASRDRGGYVFVKGAVLLHLASDLAPEWVIGYRDALNAASV